MIKRYKVVGTSKWLDKDGYTTYETELREYNIGDDRTITVLVHPIFDCIVSDKIYDKIAKIGESKSKELAIV